MKKHIFLIFAGNMNMMIQWNERQSNKVYDHQAESFKVDGMVIEKMISLISYFPSPYSTNLSRFLMTGKFFLFFFLLDFGDLCLLFTFINTLNLREISSSSYSHLSFTISPTFITTFFSSSVPSNSTMNSFNCKTSKLPSCFQIFLQWEIIVWKITSKNP